MVPGRKRVQQVSNSGASEVTRDSAPHEARMRLHTDHSYMLFYWKDNSRAKMAFELLFYVVITIILFCAYESYKSNYRLLYHNIEKVPNLKEQYNALSGDLRVLLYTSIVLVAFIPLRLALEAIFKQSHAQETSIGRR